MGTMTSRALASRSRGAERLLLATLCMLGVLAWVLTMSSMSPGQLESLNSAATLAHSAATPFTPSNADADPVLGSAQFGASGIGHSTISGIELACAFLGTGCLLALVVLAIRMILPPPGRSRGMPGSASSVRVRPTRARLVLQPSLIALSISRT